MRILAMIELIAEQGINHNGNLDTAKKLIDLAVASNFLHHLWLEPLLIPKRENLTFALINAITNKCCRPEIKELLERLVLIGLNFPLMERRNYWITICKWCYGHFVPIPLWKP